MRDFRSVVLPVTFLMAVVSTATAQPAVTDQSALEFFEKKVRPALVEHCYSCHSTKAKKVKGGLFLDSREGLLKGGDTGPVIVPGKPEQSRLVEAIGYKNVDLQMPPKGKLAEAVIADLTAWVKSGAAWPADQVTTAAATKIDIAARKRSHWAWQPLRPVPPPIARDRHWPQSPVDAFILARLELSSLKPAVPADRRTLLRRVTFDLIGLPPTPDEIDAFLRDESSQGFEHVVDRLLASPRFGERWARHWLDLVRYAESRGHELDYTTPNAYQYRDYVIRAFNADVPYDRFVTEHLAGDLLERPRLHSRERFNESILGTGFWFLGEEVHSPVDTRQDEADRFDNRIDVMTKAFLGLTVACARCHDHKFDAISSRDYYALFGFLESSSYQLVRFDSLECNRRIARELAQVRAKHRPELYRALASWLRPTAERLGDYLLAAREALLAGSPSEKKAAEFSPGYRQKLTGIAEARQLRPDVLAAWVDHLNRSLQDGIDLFHEWATVAADIESREPQQLNHRLAPLVAALRERENAASSALKDAAVVIDYSRVNPGAWLPDDCGFGTGPQRPGDAHVVGDVQQPKIRLTERGAAVYDRAWDGLCLAPGAENDPSAIGKLVRAGRSIRTPSFALTTGRLYYLVRGVGQAYAAVGQHTLINGPLHAQLVAGIKTGDQFQWVVHDLTAYKGQLTHVEFTAAGGHDFEIAMVVQAERPPALAERPCGALLQTIGDAQSLQTLAANYQRLFLDLCEKLDGGRLTEQADAIDCARLANWALSHPVLFGNGDAGILTETARRALEEQNRCLKAARMESRLALAMLDGTGVDERVFVRGSPKALGEATRRRFLEALAGAAPLSIAHGSGRLELARQITDPAINPLLPRVMVNRVWHHLFGRGIVASVDNFGVLGEPPTHPELLEYLADRFVKQGWSVKKLIRQLVLTSAYQMASQSDEPADQADPQNLLLHRTQVRRLEGEAIRDAMLAVSGRLDGRVGGPSVPVYLTPFLDGRGRPKSGPLDGDGRRSLYLAVRRNFLSPMLLAFDTPIPFSTVGRRTVSNVPAQSLILLNDPFVHEQAETWARRVLAEVGSPDERIARMYVSAFGREPTEKECGACLAFVKEQARLHGTSTNALPPWKDLAHTLFNVKEFIFLN